MRHIHSALLISTLVLSSSANALVISDIYSPNQLIPNNGSLGTIFELIPLGYTPATDTITNVKLTYDFQEIFSSTNEGDTEQYNDPNYPIDGTAMYEDESAIISSWIFNWRDYFPDIDTEVIVYETDWVRSNMCQYEAFGVPSEDSTSYCLLNLDLYGNLNAGVTSFSDNLWLNSISVEVEINRQTQVPEPSSVLLFGLGLLMISLVRYRKR